VTDEAYILSQENRDKKITAHSAAKRVGKRKRVTFPSDMMTKKEIKKMSGEVKTYNLKNPMKWAEYRTLPDDLKKAHLTRLHELYNASNVKIAAMLGVSDFTVRKEEKRLGIAPKPKYIRTSPEWESFVKWGTPERETKEKEVVIETAQPVEETICVAEPDPAVAVSPAPIADKPSEEVVCCDRSFEAEAEKAKCEIAYLRERNRALENDNLILKAQMAVVELIFGNRR